MHIIYIIRNIYNITLRAIFSQCEFVTIRIESNSARTFDILWWFNKKLRSDEMYFASFLGILITLIYVVAIGLGLYIAVLVIQALKIYIRNNS